MESLFVCFYIILFVHCSQLNIYKILHFFSSRIIIEGKWSCAVGVSMFDPTREHDTNPTRVFSG